MPKNRERKIRTNLKFLFCSSAHGIGGFEKKYIKHGSSMDESVGWSSGRGTGENDHRSVGSYEDKFSNIEETVFGAGSDRVSRSIVHKRGSDESVAR